MRRYRVQVQCVRTVKGWTTSWGLPTFELDGEFHGIRTEAEAERFVRQFMLAGLAEDVEYHPCAVEV